MITEPLTLASLVERNDAYAQSYARTPLMVLIRSSAMAQPQVRSKLLDAIQIFSTYFQKTMMLRGSFSEPPAFAAIAREHLAEEFGHDTRLATERNTTAAMFDPILEGTTCWFAWQMLAADNIEKLVLIQLVLETSASIFFPEANRVMQQYGETEYFAVHAEVDDHHKSMGMHLLADLRPNEYARLLDVLDRGWKMLFTVCDRIAGIAMET